MDAKVRNIIRTGLDDQIDPTLRVRDTIRRPAKGWLRAVRTALAIKQERVAERMGVKRQSYAQLEDAEDKRVITLKSLLTPGGRRGDGLRTGLFFGASTRNGADFC
jgi:DNA-binding XRE family transcriptional regulator